MTQSKLEQLLKIDNESYNLLRVLTMFMKLDRSQDVPLQAIAVFWFVATYQNCSKKNIEEYFKMSKASASRLTDYLSRYHRLGKAGLGLISKESDPKDKRRTLLKLTRKGKDLIEKSFSTLYEDIKDYEIDYED
jgi:DNA-binding MarR family transcriptional regulator